MPRAIESQYLPKISHISSAVYVNNILSLESPLPSLPQGGAADAQTKVPFDENTELKKVLPFEAWNRSVYSHACYTYCQGVLPC